MNIFLLLHLASMGLKLSLQKYIGSLKTGKHAGKIIFSFQCGQMNGKDQ